MDMIQAFVAAFHLVFTWSTMSPMLVGIVIGFVVGILPGLGGPTALALMLPFIFKMTPIEAFAFLLGMAAVTATTGDITSVLFGVPGEATTASTVVDGHPMAKNGEAGRALGAALMSSLVGAVFGALALALAIPIVRPLVLMFGSPEMFMLSLLGVSFIVTMSENSLIKGLITAGLGFLLATVGIDQISGIQRYTFGQLFLWDGIGLVPVAVGLFAIPEIIELAVHRGSIAKGPIGKLGGVMQGVKDTFLHFWLVIRCSAIGTYLGLIPGFGAGVSQWIAYAHAVQSSPNRERFGKGAVEGVLGPGAANNSSLGGTLIPCIAFGVPGSLTMAILLGAFIVQGIVPGPDMLLPEPKGRLSLTFSFVWIIVVSNLITVAVCFMFLRQLARLTQIRSGLLVPFILLLVFLGAFAEKNAFEDMAIVILFGAIGWVMVKLDWPRPPLLLGLVLGPLMENRLFLSVDNYGYAWLLRPGVLIIFALLLTGILYPIWKRKRERMALARIGMEPARATENRGAKGVNRREVAFLCVLIAILAAALWTSRAFGYRAGLFPWVIGIPLLGLMATELMLALKGRATGAQAIGEGAGSNEAELPPGVEYRRTASMSGWIFGAFALIWLLGFPWSFPLILFAQLKIAAGEKWPTTLVVTACGWAFFYGVFVYGLHIPFPEGLIFEWLS
ncbi:MAG: hypothetical protein EXR27_03750 [Betaproteobacteria bacterium]|nr:hypothetical protein [Betaproteobacteria bacterium]